MMLENNILVLLIVIMPFIMAAVLPLLGKMNIQLMTWAAVISAFMLNDWAIRIFT